MIFVAASTCSAQKSNWYLFQPNNQGINVEFGNASCNQGSNFFKPIKPYTNQTFQNYLAVNTQTDKKGKILFYLLSTLDSVYLYNSKNECVKVLPGYDISPMIVPLPGGVRYHVLVGNNLYWFNLSDLTKAKNDIFDYQNATVSGLVKINVSAQEPKYAAKRAVKILKYSCDTFIYRLYSLEANMAGSTGRFVRSRDIVTIGGETTTNTGICSLEIHSNNNIDIHLEYSISEMELSPNKNELVFSGGSCLLRVDVSGSQFGSATRTCFNSSTITNDSNRFFCGVEYLTDTLILLSQFQTKDSSSANQGLYLFNKIHHTFTKITNSDGFKYSYLEKGRDGKAYFTKGDGLYRFDRNSSVISKVLNLTLVPTLPFLKLVTVEFLTPEVRVFSLPSIIDNYENETLNDKESVVNSISIKSPKFSNKQTFGNSNHKLTPRGYGEIVVLDSLIITNIAKWVTFDSMTIQFAEGSFLRIMGGSDLELKGTKLMGTCGEMWNGIEIVQNGSNNSRLTCRKNAVGRKTMIRDALIGVKVTNSNHSLKIGDSTVFLANQLGIQLKNALQNLNSITNTIFIDSAVLNNGEKTRAAMDISCSSLKIGHLDSLPIIVIGGIFGINTIASNSIEIQNVNFFRLEKSAINILNTDVVKISNTITKNCNKTCSSFAALQVDGFILFEFKRNIIEHFSASTALGIFSKFGGRTMIGGALLDSNRILFHQGDGIVYNGWTNNFFMNSISRNFEVFGRPLTLFSNSTVSLFVGNNRIIGRGSGIGIKVLRNVSSMAGRLYFDTLSIFNNRLDVQNGIFLDNINTKEPNKLLPLQSDWSVGYSKRHLFGNRICLNNNMPYLESNAMNLINTDHVYCVGNSITHAGVVNNRPYINSHSGVYLKGAQNSLIFTDSFFSLYRGVVIDGVNYFSNIYCNLFLFNRNAIKLEKSELRLKYNTISFIPFNHKVHGMSWSTIYTARSNTFVLNSINSSIFFNNNLTQPDYCKWILEQSTLSSPYLLSAPKKRDFIFPTVGGNPCGNFMANPNSANSKDPLNTKDFVNDPVENFWNNYGNVKYNIIYAKNYVTPSFCRDLINLELALDTGSISQIQTSLNNLTPTDSLQGDVKFVFGNWVKYISHYDTTFIGVGKMKSFQIWDSDSSWHFNSLVYDTSSFNVNYSPLPDSIILRLKFMAKCSPFNRRPASYFARNLLAFMGVNNNYIDSFFIDVVPITGRVTANCFGGGTQGITVKLFDEYNNYTGVNTVSEAAGYFRFSGDEINNLDTSKKYYVRVYLPSDSNHISVTAKIANLQFDSLLNIDCIFPGPQPLDVENISKLNIRIHPNPADEKIIISGFKGDLSLRIFLYDAAGSLKVFCEEENNAKFGVHLDVSQLNSGLYQIRIESTDIVVTEKIIILH